jgi:hypothetical protein
MFVNDATKTRTGKFLSVYIEKKTSGSMRGGCCKLCSGTGDDKVR